MQITITTGIISTQSKTTYTASIVVTEDQIVLCNSAIKASSLEGLARHVTGLVESYLKGGK